MLFETTVRGIKCYCEVTEYSPEVEMTITGSGFGDCEPPEPEEFYFIIRGLHGKRRMRALEEQVDQSTRNRLLKEYKQQLLDL